MAYRPRETKQDVSFTPVPNPWEARDATRSRELDSYMASYLSLSTLYTQAIREGWDLDLMRYVRAVAWVQVQMLHPGTSGIGYDASVIFSKPPTAQQIASFFADQARQARTGSIEVGVPTGMIDRWRFYASKRAEKQQMEQAPVAAPVIAEKEKTKLDLEIERQIAKKAA